MLVALVFVLARSVIKLLVERRRGLPFARFRAKLVAVLLGMTLVPAVLVLLVGSELIRNSVDRWFNAPMDEMLDVGAADRQRLLPRAPAAGDRRSRADRPRARRPSISARPMSGRCATWSRRSSREQRVSWSRSTGVRRAPAASRGWSPVVDVASPTLPAG